jgi:hypothetical protein
VCHTIRTNIRIDIRAYIRINIRTDIKTNIRRKNRETISAFCLLEKVQLRPKAGPEMALPLLLEVFLIIAFYRKSSTPVAFDHE